MHSKLWILVSSVALVVGGTACKNRDDKPSASATSIEAARDNVRAQAQDVREQVNAVAVKEGDLASARADLARARGDYTIELRARLAKVDARIAELRARTDDQARVAAAQLLTKRDALSVKIDSAATLAESSWDVFKSDVAFSFEAVERDVAIALR